MQNTWISRKFILYWNTWLANPICCEPRWRRINFAKVCQHLSLIFSRSGHPLIFRVYLNFTNEDSWNKIPDLREFNNVYSLCFQHSSLELMVLETVSEEERRIESSVSDESRPHEISRSDNAIDASVRYQRRTLMISHSRKSHFSARNNLSYWVSPTICKVNIMKPSPLVIGDVFLRYL